MILKIEFDFKLRDNELEELSKKLKVKNDDKLKEAVTSYLSEEFSFHYSDCVNFVDLFEDNALDCIKEILEGENE